MASTPVDPAGTARPGPRRPPRVDHTQVGFEVVSGLAEPSPTEPAPPPSTAPVATDVVFPPRRAARGVLGVLLLVALLATAGAAYVAADERTTSAIGAAVALGLVTLVLYAVRAGSSPARVSISAGHLRVERSGRVAVVDLTNPATRLETLGRARRQGDPRNLGWKVLVARVGGDPLVVDSSMVDPVAFTAAVDSWRPRSEVGTR